MHQKNIKSSNYLNIKTSNHSETVGRQTSSAGYSPRLQKTASERLKVAKSLMKRVESFQSGNNRKIGKDGAIVEISGPVSTDSFDMNKEKIKHLNCKDINEKTESISFLEENFSSSVPVPWSDETTNFKQLSHQRSCDMDITNSNMGSLESQMQELDLSFSLSDSNSNTSLTSLNGGLLGSKLQERYHCNRWTDSSDLYYLPQDYVPGKFPKSLWPDDDGHMDCRSGSFVCEKDCSPDSSDFLVKQQGLRNLRIKHRGSLYDNVPIEENLEAAQEELDDILHKLFDDINGLNKAVYGENADEYEPPQVRASEYMGEILDECEDNDNEITVSSADNSDNELQDFKHDSTEKINCLDRRDSGVGSSLTRSTSDRQQNRIRWHSFQKSHHPSFSGQNMPIMNLSVCQIMVLQKLYLCRLTGLIEKYSQNRFGLSWSVPRFMKRHKMPDYKDCKVFGIPLTVTLQRSGQPLPQCILSAMRFLRNSSKDAIGIFRKAGVRSRIQKLKIDVEANPDSINFEDLQAYDVADLLKQYFRELPECLMTNKLSEIFLNIFISFPTELRLEALQAAIILLPDENRQVLQSLLFFLADISKDAPEHQMTASNLAVCFAPSLFSLNGVAGSPSPRRPRKNLGIPDTKELMEQKAAHECLTVMITDCKHLFMIPEGMMSKCRFSYVAHGDPISLQEFKSSSSETDTGYNVFVNSAIQALLKESHDKFRGWVSSSVSGEVDVSFKKVGDGHPLRLWKCCVDVEAPPEIALERIRDERHTWDEDLLKWYIVEKLDNQTDVFYIEQSSLPPHPSIDICLLRGWKTGLTKGSCALVATSVEHPNVKSLQGIQGVVLVSHFLIEPCGAGKSRIIFMSRIDLRGRTTEWYKRSYGHICASLLGRIKESFKKKASGPESTV